MQLATVNQLSFDVLILGAGAAGLMAAIEAGRRGRRVAVLERAERPGKKILISGGGRCNFTNLHTRPDNFLSANPHFAKSALARYTPADFIRLVERHGIAYHEKTLGQLFCDGSAQQIVDLLMSECADAGVRVFLSTAVSRGAPRRFFRSVLRSSPATTSSSRPRSSSLPAACRFRKWAQRDSATTLPASFDSH